MTPQQRDALKQALEQHSLSMAVKDAAPEDVAALPQDFAVPTYNANNQPLYDNQLFPAVNSAEDLVARGYATPDGQVTESGQMALSLKKVGALNDDYTLNDTGKTLMASRDDLLKEENIDLYREYKRLELDEAPDVGIWDSIKDIASKTVQGANVIAQNELGGIKDIASSQIFGGAFDQYGAEALTPEKRAESRITTEEAAKDLFASSAGLARAAATEIDKVAAKTMWDGMMQDYQVSYLEQKYDRDLADMEKVNTAEVADELAKVIGLETQFAEGRQQAEQLIGPEATQQAIEGGRAAGLTLSLVNPLAPEALAARVGFGVAQKGVTAAFKPIARKLLESENKAAQALAANQRVNGLNSHLAQTQYLAKSAEDQAVFAERQADKLSKMGIVDRANSARALADNLRTKGLEAGARAQGLTDEIARASDEAAKLAQDAAVADKINFVAQRARELPGMPLQAIGGLIEGTGKAMIGIDKGLSTIASKIGADKAWNAMNRISSLSGLGGAGAVMGLGPAAFVPAAIRTAWSTAPFLKGAGNFVRMVGKETANARGQIPFWQRVANYENLGSTQRAVAHLMDTATIGGRLTGAAGDVAKGMAAAYPVDLAFQWLSDGGEMDMNTLKQAAAETVVFGGGGALGGIVAGSPDRIKRLQRGDALNFYRNLKDGGQRVAFNALNDGMKRSIGTYASSFPNLNVRFTDQGGGAFDKATNTAFINPMARNPLKPLLAHEINHYILVRNQMEGGVAAALVGDGVQTGGILRGKDGKLDENFQAFKDEYTRRLESQHNRQVDTRIAAGEKIPARERTFTPPTDNDMAIEYFVDSMADDMMGMAETGELGKQAGRMLVTRKMQSLGNAILQQAPIIKDFFYKLGGATDKSGRAVYGNGLLAEGIREIPEMKKLFRKMISESAGRPMHVAKVTKGESDGHAIPIIGKDDPILNEMTSLWETNADGVPLRDKNGDYIPLSDQTEQLRASSGLMLLEDQQNRINRGETLEQGELRFNPEENAWTGEYLTDRQIQILRTSGRFNNAQLRQLDMLNGAAKENTGRRFLVFNQPATKKRKGKRVAYDTLGVSMREIVPYGIKITKDGNLLVRLMSVQQLHANAFEKAASKRGQALYKGNAEQILNDVNQVIENHGRNEPTDAYFKSRYGNEWEVRKNFINTAFGNVGKGQKDINPLLAAEKAKNAVVKTYRIDRINKATELEGRTNLPYQNHLVKVNFMPEGEPILDENGEPKDLRYTPSYEAVSQVRMPEAQRAMPEGVSPEDLNPVANKQEAQGLWADGKRMFALNEMDEKLTPITSKAMLDSYSADAIGWIEPESQAGQMRFMPEADQNIQQTKQWNPNPIVATNKTARVKGIPERITDELFELIKNKPIVVGMADLLGAGGKIRGVDVSGGPGYPIQNFDPSNPDAITGVWASERGGINTILQNMVKTDSIWQDESGHNWALFAPHTMAQSAHKSNAQTPEIYISKVNDMAISGALKKATAIDLSDHIRANVPMAKDMPNIGTEKLTKFIHDAAFETRAAIMSELSNVRSRDLGAPSPETILTESRDPQYHGVEKNALTGLLLIDVDRLATKDENGNWKLRNDLSADDFNVPKHPSYGTVMPGKVLAHFDNPVPFRISTPEMINTMRTASPLSRIDYLLARMPKDKGIKFQPLTDQIKNTINEAQNISGNVPYIREAVKAVNGNWKKFTSGASLKGLAELIGAIHRSPARDSLTQYNLSELQKMIKEDKMEVHQLGDNDIWFGVKKSKDGNELVSVVNNTGIPGMLNLIMQRALEVGVNKLDAYAVPTSKTPNGLLPSLYKRYGWKEVERMPFDRQYLVERKKGEKKADHEEKIAQKEAALKMFWTEQGWDGQSNPDVVFMTYEKGRKTEITSGQSEGSLVKQRVAESGAASEAASGEVRGAGLAGGREQAPVGGPTQGDSGTGEGVLPRGFDSIVQGLRSASPIQIETIGITDAERKQFLKKLGIE
jgi:hypothetical protein